MGQRANYIIQTHNNIDIYYTHWRANYIVSDLLLDQRKFMNFVNRFDKESELIQEPWIEGCVYLNIELKELLFWEIAHLHHYSVRTEYISLLRNKWPGWSIKFAEKEMYDIEKALDIDYTSVQETDFEKTDINTLINDSSEDCVSCSVVIKSYGEFLFKTLYTVSDEELVFLGEEIVDILLQKPSKKFMREADINLPEIVVIDCDEKRLYINQSITGLKEAICNLWPLWNIECGNFGYINMLNKIGYDSSGLIMSNELVNNAISEITEIKDTFNPIQAAKRIIEDDKDIKFNPHFFEDIKPKRSLFKRFTSIFTKTR
jgi:hypothetical protein